MTEFRENLMNSMINLYGLEHPCVIQFCNLAETLDDNEWNNRSLELLAEAHMADPYGWENNNE